MVRFNERVKRCGEVLSIPVNSIRPNPNQPRKSFPWEELDRLAQSIHQNGLLQPVTVRELESGKYELVAGERRLRASKMAGLAEIPAIIVNISNEKSAIYAVVENLQRQNLHFFEEAQAIEKLSKNFGMEREKIAKKLGKSVSAVSNKLRLLKLPEDIRTKIILGGLTERHARAVLRLTNYDLMDEVVTAVIENVMNVAETEELVSRLVDESESKQSRQSKPKKIKVFKDMKIFINTIEHAVETMRENGILADSIQRETDEFIEYVVRISKKDVFHVKH